MMRNILCDLFLAALLISFLSGCAAMTSKDDSVESVVTLQVDVLKKIVTLRQQELFKLKIQSDPVLAEQEHFLLSGLSSVISSQETYLKARNKPETKRGADVR